MIKLWNTLSNSRYLIWLIFGICGAPVLAAVWCVPWFVTADGPAHTYNSYILIQLLKPNSSFGDVYAVRSYLLPNLAGHFVLMGLMSLLSGRTADRFIVSLTFVGFLGSLVWLRWQVAGRKGIELIIPLSAVLALNWMWLMGFYNFLLGTCLFSITLGVWWAGRRDRGIWRAIALAGLLVVGYICHIVGLGLTVVALLVLSLATAGRDCARRCLWTSLSFLPLIPLVIMYHAVMQTGGSMHPSWGEGSRAWSLGEYIKHLLSSDPLRLMRINSFPFVDWASPWFNLLNPALWVAFALALLVLPTIYPRGRDTESLSRSQSPWALLSFLLIIAGLIGPDDFGSNHGMFLRERVLLFGMVTVVPALKIDLRKATTWAGAAALMVAFIFQVASVWDYAFYSNRLASNFMQAKPYLGTSRRIKTILVFRPEDPKGTGRFRASPLSNLSNMLGANTDNTIWDNYEAVSYFFPIKYRDEFMGNQALKMVSLNSLVFPEPSRDPNAPLDRWSHLLAENHSAIDELVVWGTDPRLDTINRQWYSPVFEQGNIHVLQHR